MLQPSNDVFILVNSYVDFVVERRRHGRTAGEKKDLPVCLSVCLSNCLSYCLSNWLSKCLSSCLSVCLVVCLVCLIVSLIVCLVGCLIVCLSVCLSVHLFVCPSLCPLQNTRHSGLLHFSVLPMPHPPYELSLTNTTVGTLNHSISRVTGLAVGITNVHIINRSKIGFVVNLSRGLFIVEAVGCCCCQMWMLVVLLVCQLELCMLSLLVILVRMHRRVTTH